MSVASVYRCKGNNIGDFASSPALYFRLPGEITKYELPFQEDWPCPTSGNVIVGGGGLIGAGVEKIRRAMTLLADRAKPDTRLICWGAGLHDNLNHVLDEPIPSFLRKYKLVGIRDVVDCVRWVPCASCMLAIFKREMKPTEEFVVYSHGVHKLDLGVPAKQANNTASQVGTPRRAIEFIASGAVVLTNTYHGAYWATLLGRKVVVINPWSTKFFRMKHPPVFATVEDWKHRVKAAVNYDEALDECREASTRFYADVMNVISG